MLQRLHRRPPSTPSTTGSRSNYTYQAQTQESSTAHKTTYGSSPRYHRAPTHHPQTDTTTHHKWSTRHNSTTKRLLFPNWSTNQREVHTIVLKGTLWAPKARSILSIIAAANTLDAEALQRSPATDTSTESPAQQDPKVGDRRPVISLELFLYLSDLERRWRPCVISSTPSSH